MTIDYQALVDPAREITAAIDRGLHQHNLEQLGNETLNRYAALAVVARNKMGEMIGGIHGELVWDWLSIETLWVREDHRGQGVGSTLLVEIERHALSRGFTNSQVETTDFQALDFYRQHGYCVFGRLEGKPAGHTYYYLKKKLTAE